MWHDPMDALIADLDGVVEATPPPCTDQMPSFMDMRHRDTRILRRLDAAWDGSDPDDEVNPTFEEEFAASVGRAGPGSTSRTRLIGHDRDRALPWTRVPGRVTRASCVRRW